MKKHQKKQFSTYFVLFLLLFSFAFTACKKEYKPEESFIKVYDDKDGSKNYFPLSIKPTADDGYLILSAYNGWNIHLLKTDNKGEKLWEFDVPAQYVNAVPNFIERNGSLYFVCMDAIGLFTYVMLVDETTKEARVFQEFPEIQYPLYVADNSTAVYIQNYKRSSFETGIYRLNSEMDEVVKRGEVSVFTDVQDKIVGHIKYTSKRFPFFVSVTPEKNQIVLSGFSNYSFSTVFLDNDLKFSGVYNGAAFDGGLSSILPLGGNNYALSRFSFSNLYYNPNASLNPNAIDIAESIPAKGQAELDAQSPVLIKSVNISGSDFVVYLATTKSNQLLLNFYGKNSDSALGNKYLGQSVPLKACDFSVTEDGGLLILARVTVMGSFNRIATIKVSKEELEAAVE